MTYVASLIGDANYNPRSGTCTYTSSTRVLSCQLGTVAPNETVIVWFQARVGLRGTLTASGTVASPNDAQPAGLTASKQVTATPISCPVRLPGGPAVQIQVTRLDANRVNVSVTASTTGAPTNLLEQLHFGPTRNAFVDFPGGPTSQTGTFDRILGDGSASTSFVIRRDAAGVAATVPYTVADYCPASWQSFAGVGASAASLMTPDQLLFGLLLDDSRRGVIALPVATAS